MKFYNAIFIALSFLRSQIRGVGSCVLVVLILSGCSSQSINTATSNTTAAPQAIPQTLKNGYASALQQLQKNKLKQAYQSFDHLTKQYPSYSGPYVNLGLIHLKQKQLKEAERQFKKAILANPSSFSAHHQLAILYRKQGQFAEAETHYLVAKNIAPNSPQIHRDLAILYDLYMGQLPKALALYKNYQTLLQTPDPALRGWIIDITNRIKVQNKSHESALSKR